jgi:lipoprotein signal peptidase
LGLILAGALGNLYDRCFIRYDMVRLKPTADHQAATLIGEVRGNRSADPVEFHDWGATGRPAIIDRKDLDGPIRRIGVVRDFIRFTPAVAGLEVWPWVFNVADVYLVVGVGLLLLRYFLEARRQAASERDAVAEQSAR